MSDAFIPQANPGSSYFHLKNEIDAAVQRALSSGWYIQGKEHNAFEKEYAAYAGTPYAYGVANGTDAVELALRAAGVSSGDLVVTVSHTAVATISAIERMGARVCFVDISLDTYTMDPASLQNALDGPARGAKAIVVVHLYGHPAEMDDIMAIAEKYSAIVVEDCAQAHGARYHGERVGRIGQLGSFSFYPTKNLGALGDGGAVVTRVEAYAERLQLLRQYGWRERYISEITGLNSRLDEVQAAILRVKLPHLDEDNARRKTIAATYIEQLSGCPLQLPIVKDGCEHVFHQFTIRTPERDALKQALHEQNVGSAILYPVPVHLQPAYLGKCVGSDCLPNTEQVAKLILSLPVYPGLNDEQVLTVCNAIRSSL